MNQKSHADTPFLEEPLPADAKVLLVDDRPENLISLESLLKSEDENITYLFADSGEQALKIALREELALILLDVQMPGMNGYEVARYLRNNSKTRQIPIIFVTAIDQNAAHVEEGFEVGAVDFLFKPLHPFITKAKVMAFVRFFLQKKKLEMANQFVLNLNRELEDRVEDRTQELVKINKDLDTFVYTASHDLKAPILNIESLIHLFRSTLDEETATSEEVTNIMGMIDGAILRFKNTLRDLTELARVQHETATAAIEKDLVSFADMLEEVKLTVVDLIEAGEAEINEDFAEAPEILFSKKNLRSILYNLVSNGIKYSSPARKPIIHVKTERAGSFVLLSVRDNGLGIKKEDQHKVFEMFKRLHSHVDGTGVGMAIVKRMVENSGGKIEIESELGKGSVFKVYLRA
jgi:two-component system, sensor histidine kinase and response regulator